MTQRFRLLLAAAPIVVLASVTMAAAPPQEQVLLARKAKVGDVSRTSGEVTIAIDAGGQQMSMVAKEIDKVTISAVAPDGAITFQEEPESMELSVNGSPMDAPGAPPTTVVVMRPDGTLVSHTDNGSGIEGRMFSATRILFSDKPVGVGTTWTRDVKANASTGLPAGVGEYKVAAFEKVGDIDTVKISMTFHETATDGIKTSGTFWIEKSTGEEVKGEYEFANVPLASLGLANGSAKEMRLPAGR